MTIALGNNRFLIVGELVFYMKQGWWFSCQSIILADNICIAYVRFLDTGECNLVKEDILSRVCCFIMEFLQIHGHGNLLNQTHYMFHLLSFSMSLILSQHFYQ